MSLKKEFRDWYRWARARVGDVGVEGLWAARGPGKAPAARAAYAVVTARRPRLRSVDLRFRLREQRMQRDVLGRRDPLRLLVMVEQAIRLRENAIETTERLLRRVGPGGDLARLLSPGTRERLREQWAQLLTWFRGRRLVDWHDELRWATAHLPLAQLPGGPGGPERLLQVDPAEG